MKAGRRGARPRAPRRRDTKSWTTHVDARRAPAPGRGFDSRRLHHPLLRSPTCGNTPAGRRLQDAFRPRFAARFAFPGRGFEAFEDSRMKFDVRYYLVAILFIIFDLEIAFLFPWAIVLDQIGTFGLVAMGIFISVLVIGFIYEWKKGALEWE